MPKGPTITVTVAEGVFVYMGTRSNGTADWCFQRKTDKGFKPAAMPNRWERILNRQRKKEG